jgi:hypothetical protein
MNSSEDPSWKCYAETRPRFWLPEPFIVDLRQQATSRHKVEFGRAGLTAPFAVLTAYNPRGCLTDDTTNASKTADLERDLRARDMVVFPVDGMSPEGCSAPHLSSGYELSAVAGKVLLFDLTRCPIPEC